MKNDFAFNSNETSTLCVFLISFSSQFGVQCGCVCVQCAHSISKSFKFERNINGMLFVFRSTASFVITWQEPRGLSNKSFVDILGHEGILRFLHQHDSCISIIEAPRHEYCTFDRLLNCNHLFANTIWNSLLE